MSFNPIFTSVAFDQKTGEVALFASLGIPLVHGWLVDPASHEEYAAVSHVVSYQSARDLINHVEHLSGSSGVGANADHAGPMKLVDGVKENFRNGQYHPALPGHYADATLKLSQSRGSWTARTHSLRPTVGAVFFLSYRGRNPLPRNPCLLRPFTILPPRPFNILPLPLNTLPLPPFILPLTRPSAILPLRTSHLRTLSFSPSSATRTSRCSADTTTSCIPS